MRRLEAARTYPKPSDLAKVYEDLDILRCQSVAKAERSCRKLKVGQVAFSPEVKLLMDQIKAYSLLKERAEGRKVSSHYLDRSLKMHS